ncbi:MAG: hypothetical protein ABI690_32965 [Chloroflexota bacterium]
MARSGDTIYEDDSAAAQFAVISNLLEREINYWCLPEKITNHPGWLAQVLAVVEVMLLFEIHGIGSSVYLEEPQTAMRWRETILHVWDGDWKPDDYYVYPYPYNEPDYRKHNRSVIVSLFDRLEGIAKHWKELDTSDNRIERK